MSVQPSGDPSAQYPPWHVYPDPIPTFVRLPARLLSPPGTAPPLCWWALDGWAIPQPVYRAFAAYSDDARVLVLGKILKVGLFTVPGIGPRCVVVTDRQVYIVFPDAPRLNEQFQTVRPPDLAAQIRANAASLPPVPGAPPIS